MARTPVSALLGTLHRTRTAARGALLWGYERRLGQEVARHGRMPGGWFASVWSRRSR